MAGHSLDQVTNEAVTALSKEYCAALREYLAGAGEAALRRASELGRQALGSGLGVLEMASVHQQCLASVMEQAAQPEKAGGRPFPVNPSNLAFHFFVQSLSPFETVLRGVQEANTRLQQSLGDLKAAEEESRRQNETLRDVIRERDKAENINRAKDEFLAILSHELRNPLMPAMGWTRVLKRQDSIMQDPTLSEGVKSLERNLQNIARLVGDCLDLTRISQGKIQLEKEAVDLNQTILAASEAVREMARNKGIYLAVEPSAAPLWLHGDPTRLQQVVMNLLVNAIKYTTSGGAIWVRSGNVAGMAELEVQDSGVGIDPKFREQIFEPFRQGTNAWLTSESGLGLGLAISRTIVDMHGGRIWAEAEGLGRGCTFRVRLPLAPPGEQAGRQAPERPARHRPRKPSQVLLIEDSRDILLLMKMELERLGYDVLTAADGVSGLQLARERPPDLIVSDVKMPGLDGYELIRNIRATPELASTPAIALTGFGMPSDVEKLRAAGFDACVSKPADPEEIFALIQKLTNSRPAWDAPPGD